MAARQSKLMGVIRVASGNFLEQFDFFVFAYFAKSIGETFFPAGPGPEGEFLSLMAALMTFGAGFLMRPLGALVLGAYIDAHGRRAGLLLTLALMAVGTLSIALTPGYATIGVAGPIVVVIGRLVQGFSAGAELGGVSVYLSEMATPGNKGFYVSWQSGSQQVAVICVALLAVGLTQTLGAQAMRDYGWRIPMLIGCCIIPFLFWIRASLEETELFLTRKQRLTARQIAASMFENWRIVLLGMMMVVMTTVSFYLITAYTPTFGKTVLKLGADESLLVALCVGVSNFVWLPIGGALSDRIGRRPVLLACTAACFLTAYPLLAWLVVAPTFGKMLAVELTLSALYGLYNGAMVVTLSEIVPPAARASGFSLAYSLAAALFGTSTPLASTWLIDHYGNQALPGVILMAAAAVAFGAALLVRAPSRVVAPSLAPAR